MIEVLSFFVACLGILFLTASFVGIVYGTILLFAIRHQS